MGAASIESPSGATRREALRFSFVIDAEGRILSFEGNGAVGALGWDQSLVGQRCTVRLACRDLGGQLLCELCAAQRAAKPAVPPRERPIARLDGPRGEILLLASSVRRLPRRRLRIEGKL